MQAIFLFLLFFLPLVVLPFGISVFETPKIIIAEAGIEILLLLALFKKENKIRDFISPLLYFVGLVTLLSLTQLFFQKQIDFFGNVFRLQGMFMLFHLIVLAVLSSRIELKIPKAVPFVSFGALAISALAMGTNQGRAFGTLGEPNALAATMIFLWPFCYFLLNKRILKTLLIFCALLVIFLSGSRSGLIAFGLQFIFILLYKNFNFSFAKTAIICFVLVSLSLILPFIEKGGIYENRSDIWKTSFFTGLRSPLIGNGFGNIEKALYTQAYEKGGNVRYQYVDSSHNLILDWWIQGGIIGLGGLIFLLYLSFKNLIAQRRELETICFLGLLTPMLFNPLSIVSLVAFWWLIGQGFSKKI